LRPVGALILFPGSRQLLLLSEREADALQRQVWAPGSAGFDLSALRRLAGSNLLVSLSYLRLGSQTDGGAVQETGPTLRTGQPVQQLMLASELVPRNSNAALTAAARVPSWLAVDALVSVQLFAGCVMYGSEAQRAQLHRLMQGKKEAAQELVGWRGKLHMLPRSNLDRACADDLFD